ncbi:MAG: hypothetical protein LBB77_01255 [Treponema sp.]|nr:hypothetical protein [Treponema sp.]
MIKFLFSKGIRGFASGFFVRSRLPWGILITVLCLFSCRQKEEIRLAPPAMSPLSRGEVGYGVVNVSYTHVADKPGGQGISLGYLRRGSVVRILERRVSGREAVPVSPETWVRVEGRDAGAAGWLPESVISIYSTEAQAHTASDALLQ